MKMSFSSITPDTTNPEINEQNKKISEKLGNHLIEMGSDMDSYIAGMEHSAELLGWLSSFKKFDFKTNDEGEYLFTNVYISTGELTTYINTQRGGLFGRCFGQKSFFLFSSGVQARLKKLCAEMHEYAQINQIEEMTPVQFPLELTYVFDDKVSLKPAGEDMSRKTTHDIEDYEWSFGKGQSEHGD